MAGERRVEERKEEAEGMEKRKDVTEERAVERKAKTREGEGEKGKS